MSALKFSPLLVLPRILKPLRNVFLPAPLTAGLPLVPPVPGCLSLLAFSEELLGFPTQCSSSNESKLSSAVLTVGELGRDIALSKASSIERFCSSVLCDIDMGLPPF